MAHEAWLQPILVPREGAYVDVGAHTGEHAAHVRARGVEVVAFEPHPVTCRRLRERLDRLSHSGRGRGVRVLEVAAWDKPTHLALDHGEDMHATFKERAGGP